MMRLAASPSSERRAFVLYLRTGRRVSASTFDDAAGPIEAKFNPYHDPRNGRFTFGPGGGGYSDGVYRPAENRPALIRTGGAEPPRNMGANGGPPLDPLMIEQVVPGLINAPAGAVIAVADPLLDLTGPAGQLTGELSLAYSNLLINQIKAIDPAYRFESFGFPGTFEGQIREINQLRWDRAAAIYRKTGDARPLQLETLRFLQERTDIEYDNALAEVEAGKLAPVPTERVSIGNYVDRSVKKDFRDVLSARERSGPTGAVIRINGREYDSTGTDLTYSIPDARVERLAYDITLAPKGPSTRQIRRFFNSDFRPDAVVIVRPHQLGPNSTYVITRPR